ncbi:hypothetical protein KJ059_08085 [Myxococcota bacterium]|nr:hypothetical protein [Myxococcota bacterium]MCZ7618762.1 hypothetical protein [Myxococcota bacterium]
MKLYHFTALEYLRSILAEGITTGDVPLGPRRHGNAVWLTRAPEPNAQLWTNDGSHVLSDDERRLHASIFGAPVPRGSRVPDKRAVRLTVEVPEGDKLLTQWLPYARLRGAKTKWFRALESSPDWYIYRGTIPPAWLVAVAPLSAEARGMLTPDGPPAADEAEERGDTQTESES